MFQIAFKLPLKNGKNNKMFRMWKIVFDERKNNKNVSNVRNMKYEMFLKNELYKMLH